MASNIAVEYKTSMDFKPIANLTRWVVWLQIATASVALLFIAVNLAEIELLERIIAGDIVTDAEIDANDLRVFGTAVVAIALILTQILIFFIWIYRARANLPALGVSDASWGPGYAVGLWFVPILHWYIPFTITREIWQASIAADGQDSWRDTRIPGVFGFWWAAHVVSSIVSMLAVHSTLRAPDTLEGYLESISISIYSDGFLIITAILTLFVVRAIGLAQTVKHGLLNHESGSITG